MTKYRVNFYKTLLNSEGHGFKCLERQIDVESKNSVQALSVAEQQAPRAATDADHIEITRILSPQHLADSKIIAAS